MKLTPQAHYLFDHLKPELKNAVLTKRAPPELMNTLKIQNDLELSQRIPIEQQKIKQYQLLTSVFKHAKKHSPFYRQHYQNINMPKGSFSESEWLEIPILERNDLQTAGDDMICDVIPEQEKPISPISTSGSTGTPITVQTTARSRFFWQQFTLREHLLHRRDFGGSLMAIRPGPNLTPGEPIIAKSWGASTMMVDTGPAYLLTIKTSIDQQKELLEKI